MKNLAILFCCALFFVLLTGANAVAAARYSLPEQGDNVGDCFCCIPSPEPVRIQRSAPPSSMPAGCFQRLGAIGLMCRMEDQPTLDIWGVTSESEGVFLLRVLQSQVDAVRPAGRVADTADDYVTVCVRENRDVKVSVGPNPEGKIHHVTLQGGLHGPVIATRDTYAAHSDSDVQDADQPDVIVHVVRYGETLFAIARIYGVSLQDIIERNRLRDGDLIRPGQELIIRDDATSSARELPMVNPQAPRPDGSLVHVVRYGETLFAIANTYGVSLQDVIERNRLADGDLIRPGQELIIRDAASPSLPMVTPQAPRPDGSLVHVVRYGETLFAIANTYGVPLQDIIERNRLADGDLIRPGQELIIRDAP